MTSLERVETLGPAASAVPIAEHLTAAWQRALAGDAQAQADWQPEGGHWAWQPSGLALTSSGPEWSNLTWQCLDGAALTQLSNMVIEVTVSGRAEAAGLSFGAYKDFLAGLAADATPRRLQLEIDLNAGVWAFRVDGQLQHRAWWDAAVHNTGSILDGVLTLKARRAEAVRYQALQIHIFPSSCRLSVIVTCYRYLQRLRVTLRNWCHQRLPHGAYEIIVVNPNSPDGTHEYLAAVASSYPHVRVRELTLDPKPVTNKAMMINRAVRASRGEWIWLTDSDCLFAPTAAEAALAQVEAASPHLYHGQRRFLTAAQTNDLIVGRRDGLSEFEALRQQLDPRAPENQPWGFTQIVHRSTLERIPYREQIGHFAHSDSLFVQDCQRRGIWPTQLEDLFCLHLDHPFAWYGTKTFL